jgi:hypothetical protein
LQWVQAGTHTHQLVITSIKFEHCTADDFGGQKMEGYEFPVNYVIHLQQQLFPHDISGACR